MVRASLENHIWFSKFLPDYNVFELAKLTRESAYSNIRVMKAVVIGICVQVTVLFHSCCGSMALKTTPVSLGNHIREHRLDGATWANGTLPCWLQPPSVS